MVAGYEVWIHGAGLEWQEPVARTICPVEEHDGPCEVPWGFTVGDDDADDVLVLKLYTSAEKADEIVRRVAPVVGDRRVELRPGRPGEFEDLRIQYEIESRS
ncbi:hypothetical protein [Kribbella sp. DT2]|uniref:hypothetical protein n=1 Tax=Kribbella sp. DT2 TaxID=3393427 RepID=UPI003CF98BB8